MVLEQPECDINYQDSEGQTALHYAIILENEALIEYLVKKGADVNLADNDGVKPVEEHPKIKQFV